jgi:RNA polymerase sigma factor (sigma-70 family)
VNSLTDQQLLRDYTSDRSEVAFAELVQRHVDLVYSAALRMVCDSHLAEDVTQGVFVALARNATQLTDRPVLSGWLHRTAQNIAAQTVRSDVRRRAREQEAAAMNELLVAEPDANWEHIAPHLDAALGELSEPDRDALLLRYFERKSAREMAQTLGISDEAAQKRVSRAVERLREFFAKHGVTVGASGLVVVISANAVQAAPVGLAVTISTATALAGTTIATTATATVTKAIAMTTLQKTLITVTIVAAVGTGIYEARQASMLQTQFQTLQQQQVPLAEKIQQLQHERDDATNVLAGLLVENSRMKSNPNQSELLRLRGEVSVLKNQASEATERARIAEENLATELSAKAQFIKHQTATINATKQLELALHVFLLDNDNQFPTNILQLSRELDGKFTIGGIDLFSLEFINNGAASLDHPNMVEFRERLVRQAPDGSWRRVYGFSDGSVQTATSNDGNFEAWEKANTYLPPPNQNQ